MGAGDIPGAWPPAEVSAPGLARLYRLLLGREAEAQVLAAAAPRPLGELVGEMVASDEIAREVLLPLAQRRDVPHERLPAALLGEDGLWFAALAGLGEPDTPGAGGGEPLAVLAGVLGHPGVSDGLLKAHGSLFTEAWSALHARAQQARLGLAGRIEFATHEFISGWAVRAGHGGPLPLEIRHDGRLVASAVACSHRPDIQQQRGGDGLVGFRARWQPAQLPPDPTVLLTLHDAATGTAIGEPYRHAHHPGDRVGVAQLLAREFSALRQRLDALAGLVPQALAYAALPLAEFDLYRQLHRVPEPPRSGAAPGKAVLVLIDMTDASASALRASVEGLRATPPGTPWAAWAVGAADLDAADTARALACADDRLRALPGWAEAMAALADPAAPDWVVLLQAGELLDPQALPWVRHAAAGAPQPPVLVYWDEDRRSGQGEGAHANPPRHHTPTVRACFDPDAMLELNVVGRSFAVQRAVLAKAAARVAGTDHPLALAQREALVWSLTRDGRFVHVPNFLLTRTPLAPGDAGPRAGEPPLQRLAACAPPEALQHLLPPRWRGRRWQRVPDPLAPGSGKPLVQWLPERPQAVVSVLVPTRDHGELVRQCLASLRALAAEPGALQFIVADNGSTDPATLQWLASAEASGELQLLHIDEPFNWSRLNNRMAESARGEHLLFLNNDTRMLSRGWDALLRGQLEDPQVGAVGARLFYEDMTVQHAGVRFGQEGFVGHVAVGQAPDAVEGFPASQLTREVSAVTGAFLACRRDTWQRVGPFDEQRLAVTYNDVDWCVRVRAAGLKVLYAPAISLIHSESKSRGFDFTSPTKQARASQERDHLVRMHPGAFAHDPFHPPALSAWSPHVTSLR
jgi:GT2 family glycosyltransferase